MKPVENPYFDLVNFNVPTRGRESDVEVEDEYKMVKPPSIRALQYFCKFEIELGIYRNGGNWICRVGDYGGIYLEDVPIATDIVIHTHPRGLDEFGCLPSTFDFIHVHRADAKFFVVSPRGMAKYWPLDLKVKERTQDLETYMQLYKLGGQSVFPWQEEQNLEQMRSLGCRWEMYPWEKIENDDELSVLLR